MGRFVPHGELDGETLFPCEVAGVNTKMQIDARLLTECSRNDSQ
jgi:hypothetical protein